MIYSYTFNPALDISGFVDDLVPNEKSYVRREVHTPGGNGINAGVIAHRLGAQVQLRGFLGGVHGNEIKRLLKDMRTPQRFISILGSTRMNVTVFNDHDHKQTRLSFPGPYITKDERSEVMDSLDMIKEKDLVIIGGSLPRGIRSGFVLKLVRYLKARKIRVIIDMPGEILKEVIHSKPFFIKPNLTEFELLTGKKIETVTQVIKTAQKLLPLVPHICVSSVEGGALLITKNEIWFGKLPKVRIRSSVGAGDSMVGAMAYLWSQDKVVSPRELLRSGLAAACATLTEEGSHLGNKKNILAFRESIVLKRI